jgi:hypothetical protein
METRASCVLGNCYTTVLHPQLNVFKNQFNANNTVHETDRSKANIKMQAG